MKNMFQLLRSSLLPLSSARSSGSSSSRNLGALLKNSISSHRQCVVQRGPPLQMTSLQLSPVGTQLQPYSTRAPELEKDFVQHRNGPVFVSREVEQAISDGSAVVALESTIITHGMMYPANLDTALQVESIVRKNGAVPATIGIIDGKVFVGLQRQQLEQLATLKAPNKNNNSSKGPHRRTVKVSRSDLPMVLSCGWHGGTTVSATSYLANLVGIRLFVTGGIGGVHRGAETTMDISADLAELARTPITVVCAGVKSILDIPKTLEVLETNGVCVAVFGGEEKEEGGGVAFPAFFTPDSGISVAYNLQSASAAARLMASRDALHLQSAILLAVPNQMEEGKVYHQKVEAALQVAQREMREKGIQGKAVTPFLLARISELTGGESLKLNQQLIEHNALVGALIAVEYSRLRKAAKPSSPLSAAAASAAPSNPSSSSSKQANSSQSQLLTGTGKWSHESTATEHHFNGGPSSSIPVVIGGSIYDIVTKAHSDSVQLDGSTYGGSVQTSLGGVGRNISDAILRLGQQCLLITAVGNDRQGQLVRENNPNAMTGGIRVLEDLPTSACAVTIEGNGECILLVGDFRVHQRIDRDFVSTFERQLCEAPIVIMDGNIATATMDYVLDVCRRSRVPVWFEPTDPQLVTKIVDRQHQQPSIRESSFEAIKFLSPNFYELQLLCRAVFGGDQVPLVDGKSLKRDEIIDASTEYGNKLLERFATIHGVLVTIGKHGIVYVSRDQNPDSTIHLGPNSSLFDDSSSKAIQSLYLPQELVPNVVNVSGAGDCMVGALVYGLLSQLSVRRSLQLGLSAAQLSVTVNDTVPINIKQILTDHNLL